MKRSSIRTFIEDGINSISPTVEFNEGQVSDYAAQRSNKYPSSLLVLEEMETTIKSAGAPLDTWKIRLCIFKIDKLDSTPQVYEDIVDHCDEIAQQLQYNYRNVISGFKKVTMDNIGRKKFVKSPEFGPDCLTGVELNFDLTAPDQTDLC